MKNLFFVLLMVIAFMFIGCNDDPLVSVPASDQDPIQTDDVVQDDVTTDDSVDEVEKEDDTEVVDDDPETILPNPCTMDPDCKDQAAHAICVSGKCTAGCKADDECAARTRCNTSLGRCLNLAASSQACSTRNCPSGCCVAEDGFTLLVCEATPTPARCGVCPQGQIFLDGNKCVHASCDTVNDDCSTLNSGKEDEKCYECQAGALICALDKECVEATGSGVTVNSYECLSAGQQCREGIDECCSGQPCVNGYCY